MDKIRLYQILSVLTAPYREEEFLKRDLEHSGPVRTDWPNYSKLSKTEYHCHLNHHYVACWTVMKETITIEVYYVGSRENAPY